MPRHPCASQLSGTSHIIESIMDSMRNAVKGLQAHLSDWQGNRINQLTIGTMVVLSDAFALRLLRQESQLA